MKIPGIGKIATFAIRRLIVPVIAKSVASKRIKIEKKDVMEAIEAEATRQVSKRVG